MPELRQPPDRNLAMELVRVTEAAALSSARLMGRGDKEGADRAAVDAMRTVLQRVPMDGIVVIGEGEKDKAPMLFNGELIGDGTSPKTDVAVDPIDGTRLIANGRPGAIAVIAVSERGSMFDPGPFVYMEKIVVGPEAAQVIDVRATPAQNLAAIAKAKNESVNDLTVMVLDRPRHEKLIAQIRAAGARIFLISDGDVAGSIATCWPESGVDVLMGIGGTPEGVISAAALKCMGGCIQGRLWARDQAERDAAAAAGLDFNRVLTGDDLVRGDTCFFAATGITGGDLLRGVRYTPHGAITQSLVMRAKSGTVRFIEAHHQLAKLRKFASIEFG